MLDMGFQDSVEEILSGSYTSGIFKQNKPILFCFRSCINIHNFIYLESSQKPQTLFFSATLPPWVQTTARKYMTKDRHLIDVIGNEKQQAAITVEVSVLHCMKIVFETKMLNVYCIMPEVFSVTFLQLIFHTFFSSTKQ